VSFFDRIRYHRAPKTPQEADALALRQLASRGANMTKPRHIVHFLLFGTEADAQAASESVRATSWNARVEAPTESRAEWTVRADDERIVSADTVGTYRTWFEQIADQHHGEYDGWEAKAKP
jgi:Regulator of ribonuclease activity B